MRTNVTFQNEGSDQKIIMILDLDAVGNLDFKIRFDPQVDARTDLGFAGVLCETFAKYLKNGK